MNRRPLAVFCAVIPLVAGGIHWRVATVQHEQQTQCVRRIQDVYRTTRLSLNQTADDVYPVYPGEESTRPEHWSLEGSRLAAYRFVAGSVSHLIEPGCSAFFPGRISVAMLSQRPGQDHDTSRAGWPTEAIWRLTGTMWYPVKNHPEKVGLAGWETELSWDRQRGKWRQIHVVTIPLDAAAEGASITAVRSAKTTGSAPTLTAGIVEGTTEGKPYRVLLFQDAAPSSARRTDAAAFQGQFGTVSERAGKVEELYLGSGVTLTALAATIQSTDGQPLSASLLRDGSGWQYSAERPVTITLPGGKPKALPAARNARLNKR